MDMASPRRCSLHCFSFAFFLLLRSSSKYMRFKATIRDQRTLVAICQLCRRSERSGVVVRLHATRLHFFTRAQVGHGMQVFAICRTESVFSEFHAQSGQKYLQNGGDSASGRGEANTIYCEIIDTVRLVHVLRQAEHCQSVSIKLTKNAKKRLVLRIAMGGMQPHVDVSHDVPVCVLSLAETESISFPLLSANIAVLELDGLTELTMFVEKLRWTCDQITFTAKRNNDTTTENFVDRTCSLVVEAECPAASFALEYKSVVHVQKGRNEGGEESVEARGIDDIADPKESQCSFLVASVTIELKSLVRFLPIRDFTPCRVLLYLDHERTIAFHVFTSDCTTLLGYMPAVTN
uniref:Checkpoint protein n=1 Tax=Trypanosoma congolense (strain IL3000) TaxID=1068625 RepID=G0URJ2_TRYCI|nr:conserved hypothetical protein [Trypanosoma congolense IL3000]